MTRYDAVHQWARNIIADANAVLTADNDDDLYASVNDVEYDFEQLSKAVENIIAG